MEEQDSVNIILATTFKMYQQHRRSARITVDAKVKIALSDRIIHGDLVNISLNGAFIIPETTVEINSMVTITIFSATTSRTISDVKAKVVSIIGDGIGVEFS